jgi:hypothetical protein
VASEITRFGEQAQRVLDSANRAVFSDAKSASVGTDFLKTITTQITTVDDARKNVTGNFDKLVKGLNAMYTAGPLAKLEQAKEILKKKLGNYLAEQRRKNEEAAEVERKRIAAEAQAQADSALEEGDTDGALDILTSAAEVQVVAAKPEVRGRGGSVLTAPRRKVGSVTNLRAFLAWLAETKTPMAMAAMGGVTVGQRELNQLAIAVLTMREAAGDESITVPGFKAEYEESIGAR